MRPKMPAEFKKDYHYLMAIPPGKLVQLAWVYFIPDHPNSDYVFTE